MTTPSGPGRSDTYSLTGVSRQQNPAFFLGHGYEVFVFNLVEKDGVESENFQPLGQLSEHAVHGEFPRFLKEDDRGLVRSMQILKGKGKSFNGGR